MIFDKEVYAKNIYKFYIENYGEKRADFWYEQPAVNVWVFRRDDKIITLKSDILTGKVTKKCEECNYGTF